MAAQQQPGAQPASLAAALAGAAGNAVRAEALNRLFAMDPAGMANFIRNHVRGV